jgi:hypothetical protein
MISGYITYNLFGIKWLKLKYRVSVPEKLEELSLKQLKWWVEHVYFKVQDWFDLVEDKIKVKDPNGYDAQKVAITKMLLGAPSWLFRNLSDDSLRDLLHTWKLYEFTLTEKYTPKLNPIEKIGNLFGPNKAEHLVPWEFAFADAFYLQYKNKPSVEVLNKFVAQLYRPKGKKQDGFTTDLREIYNHEADVLHLKTVERADYNTKLVVLYWYEQWRYTLPKLYKHLFTKNNNKKAASHQSWLPIFTSASNGIHNFEKIKYMNLLILFAELNRLMKERIDQEKQLKKK